MQTLETNVINTWGNKGKAWLLKLPSLIEILAQHWSLTEITPVKNMSYNFVALTIQHKKIPVVLKISCDEKLIANEYNALKHFNGQGMVKLFDYYPEHNALLLQQAIPGDVLKAERVSTFEQTVQMYAQVVKALATQPLPQRNYPHARNWCAAIDRITDQRIEKYLVDKAKQLKSIIFNSTAHEYLCHGDLHLENIIKNGENWLAIDPKGIVGEMAFEAAAFDLLSKDELLDISTIPQKIITRLTTLANALEINLQRLLIWVYLRTIISAQWFIEDNGDPHYSISLANHIYPLL